MRKLSVLLALAALLSLAACGATKTLHCDGCGKELAVSESSNMDESWIVYCETCEKDLFGEDYIN